MERGSLFFGGGVKPGRDRMHLYWESLKNANARENALSWRTEADDSPLSKQIALEHELETQRLHLESYSARNAERAALEEAEYQKQLRDNAHSKAVGTTVTIDPAGGRCDVTTSIAWP